MSDTRTEKKCPDCGVYYEAGAGHFSGCKSHPGEVALTSNSVAQNLRKDADVSDAADMHITARAFRNAADEIERLQRENAELQHDLERAMRNHNADLNADETSE